MKRFKTVCIIGVGLIGGSIGLGLKKRKLAESVLGVGRNLKKLRKAQRLGVIDVYTTDWKKGVENADICIIATPVNTIFQIFRNIYPFLKNGCIVTDVGSVKSSVVKDIENFILEKNVNEKILFIGSHPLAGSEKAGIDFAKDDLLNKAKVIVTPTHKTSTRALLEIKEFWKSLGSDVMVMNTQRHDRLLAAVSHLPHIIAFSLVKLLFDADLKEKEIKRLVASGFKDTTRIAGADADIWTDIFISNRKYINQRIRKFQKILEGFRRLINSSKNTSLKKHLQKIATKRKKL